MIDPTWLIPKVDLYARVEVIEPDAGQYNHLFTIHYHGREMLIAATGPAPVGQMGRKVWVTLHNVRCELVITYHEIAYTMVTGQTWLCNGDLK